MSNHCTEISRKTTNFLRLALNIGKSYQSFVRSSGSKDYLVTGLWEDRISEAPTGVRI